MNGEQRYRVWNKCKYDIGVTLINGQQLNIKAGSFQLLTVNDILFIESICNSTKFFSAKMLVPIDNAGKEIPLDELGLYVDENTVTHMDDSEIEAMLKKSVKQIETWLNNIEDMAELHAIFEVAKKLDLSASKLRLLNTKMPYHDWLNVEE